MRFLLLPFVLPFLAVYGVVAVLTDALRWLCKRFERFAALLVERNGW